ncbi:undecaprenyl-diphosphatase [Rhodobacter sp. TJ_12]|uniref:undecaprenyl-diphosphate phosphatase n=1 Tax=Rhodobacter sp. TJ_12 TaxID=2029399 RepID=UPI001CBF7723|nr:undecaprenyl-diphosphate phosphatase [Rhodobacter sp. TJ_12]MBZ4023575.1 undecaprenyl-diphosphatase [Rhodobacter sp. TJ_12]
MSYWADVALGVIEGITEFLPISSTGHLLLAENWLGARSDTYNIAIQAGAILAVTLIYWRRIVGLFTGLGEAENRDYMTKLGVAFGITAILGLLVKKMGFELPETVMPVAIALVVGGVWMIVAERLAERKPDCAAITMKVAIAVGVAQIIAGVFPGTSRSASTIFIAMLLGTTNRAAATEFAFLVGIPTMYAATAYELLKQLGGEAAHEDWTALGIAFAVSTVTAFVAVKWLLGYIRTHRFTIFAWYRIVFGGALLVLVAAGVVA